MMAIMETQMTTEHLKLSEDQIDMLARPLVHFIAAFFADPENERQFQEWQRAKKEAAVKDTVRKEVTA